ncbi:MAG: glycosyltransferase family 4 protein, partial [Pseudomonadota bacterium]
RTRRVRAPVIAMIHHPLGLETGLSADRAAFLRRNEAAALSHATHTIVPSAETARILVSEFGGDPNQITIAPPGFHRPRVERQPCAPPLILSVGLLAPRKGHDVLLDALAQIVDLPWQATIVGRQYDPEVTEALKNQRAKLDLDARVAFAGELPAPELAAMFNAASIFALATRYEGYGMALCEALLYGLPIVSCRAGAVPETTRGAGILVPPDDSPSFAEALRCLLSNPDIAEDHRARALRVSEGLPDWETTARIFADVIRRVSGSRS